MSPFPIMPINMVGVILRPSHEYIQMIFAPASKCEIASLDRIVMNSRISEKSGTFPPSRWYNGYDNTSMLGGTAYYNNDNVENLNISRTIILGTFDVSTITPTIGEHEHTRRVVWWIPTDIHKVTWRMVYAPRKGIRDTITVYKD